MRGVLEVCELSAELYGLYSVSAASVTVLVNWGVVSSVISTKRKYSTLVQDELGGSELFGRGI